MSTSMVPMVCSTWLCLGMLISIGAAQPSRGMFPGPISNSAKEDQSQTDSSETDPSALPSTSPSSPRADYNPIYNEVSRPSSLPSESELLRLESTLLSSLQGFPKSNFDLIKVDPVDEVARHAIMRGRTTVRLLEDPSCLLPALPIDATGNRLDRYASPEPRAMQQRLSDRDQNPEYGLQYFWNFPDPVTITRPSLTRCSESRGRLGLLIHEDMRILVAKDGYYEIRFIATAPVTDLVFFLQIRVAPRTQDLTMAPIASTHASPPSIQLSLPPIRIPASTVSSNLREEEEFRTWSICHRGTSLALAEQMARTPPPADLMSLEHYRTQFQAERVGSARFGRRPSTRRLGLPIGF